MKTIILTGASQGIGFSTAIKLADSGHQVIAIARNETKLENLASSKSKGTIIPVSADVSTAEGRKKVIQASQNFSIDVLINNAAILVKKPFSELTLEDWKHQFEVNLFSVVELIRMVKPLLSSPAHIVNIGSMGGFQGSKKFEGLSAYGASKAALANLTESLAIEYSRNHISVNCLALGAVSTEMLHHAFPGFSSSITPKEMGTFIANFALNNGSILNGKVIPVSVNNPT